MLIVRLQKPGNPKSSHWSKFQLADFGRKNASRKFFKKGVGISNKLNQFLECSCYERYQRRKMTTHQKKHLPKFKRSTEWTRFDQPYLGEIYTRSNMQLGKFWVFKYKITFSDTNSSDTRLLTARQNVQLGNYILRTRWTRFDKLSSRKSFLKKMQLQIFGISKYTIRIFKFSGRSSKWGKWQLCKLILCNSQKAWAQKRRDSTNGLQQKHLRKKNAFFWFSKYKAKNFWRQIPPYKVRRCS